MVLSNLSIKDISFPSRNLVAHGKGFSRGERKLEIIVPTSISLQCVIAELEKLPEDEQDAIAKYTHEI